jgi:hypothetical protein
MPTPTARARDAVTQTTPPVTPDVPTPRFGGGAAAAVATPPKLRRRTGLIALGIALVCLGGAGAAYLATSVGDTNPVLTLRQDVARGEVIEAEDLTVARINADPALSTVPAGEQDAIVGQRAAVDLSAGSILTPESTTTELVPATGQSLVGVPLSSAQLPSQGLTAGDQVRIVATPRDQDDPPATAPTIYPATVVATSTLPDTGQVVVDVTVPAASAGQLAAQVATGRIALVLDSAER